MEKALTTGIMTAALLLCIGVGFVAGRMTPALDIFGLKVSACTIKAN